MSQHGRGRGLGCAVVLTEAASDASAEPCWPSSASAISTDTAGSCRPVPGVADGLACSSRVCGCGGHANSSILAALVEAASRVTAKVEGLWASVVAAERVATVISVTSSIPSWGAAFLALGSAELHAVAQVHPIAALFCSCLCAHWHATSADHYVRRLIAASRDSIRARRRKEEVWPGEA